MMHVTSKRLVEEPLVRYRHVVLLGAGASRAAFPNGDAASRRIPVMNDLVDIIGLQPLLDGVDLANEQGGDFEAIYSRLASQPEHAAALKEVERRIDAYFSALSLPERATIYDRLLVSLRPTDAVITFNWDPFLFDAYQRNRDAVSLPEIFFLHGNVRIGACGAHDCWGERQGRCLECGQTFADVPLLYPIQKKDYSKDPYIRRNWEAAKSLFTDAFSVTIFGYGAPDSDADAVELLRRAWFGRNPRTFEHIEIIDIAPQTLLHQHWSSFTPTFHYQVSNAFEQSRIARWPRRSCEAVFYPMTQGLPCEDFPLPNDCNVSDLQAHAAIIAQHEA